VTKKQVVIGQTYSGLLKKGDGQSRIFIYADDVQEGLSISSQSPIAPPETPYERLHPKPKPTEILAEAFRRAGVQIQGMGSGSGVAITTATITISIGRRRRDAFAVLPRNYLAGATPRQPAITDDDF
jgi:hypothetical protein